MTYRNSRGFQVALLAAALAACSGQDSQRMRQLQALTMRLAEIAGQANGAAPATIDTDTRLDGAKAGPGLMLTTTYTLVNAEAEGVDSTTFEGKLGPIIRQGGCDNDDLRPLIAQGVVVVLEYRDIKGNAIGTISLNRDVCGALSRTASP
jgi:hypothetical protein